MVKAKESTIRIAVIGAGISGLGAAYALAQGQDVEVFERDTRAGGHSNTVLHDGLALDTGLLVHNGRNYPLLTRETYFATIDRLLAPGGWACVQTILIPDQRYPRYRKTPDWIERYVFPGCLIPSVAALQQALAGGSTLSLHGLEEIGPHYAETLRRWRASFHERIDEVRDLGYDRRFERIWDFYLAFCEAGFRTRWLRDAQLVLARSGEGLP